MFLLAGAGLLDNRRATITWWLQSELRQRHPAIDLAADAVITTADRIVCAAGPMSWVDLLLRLIEMVDGKEIAKLCADYVVIDTAQRTQSIFMPVGYLLSQDPLLTQADLLVRRTGKRPMTVKRLADALGLSERTLNRKFQELTASRLRPSSCVAASSRPHAAGDDDAAGQDHCARGRLRGREQLSQGVPQAHPDVAAGLSRATDGAGGIAGWNAALAIPRGVTCLESSPRSP